MRADLWNLAFLMLATMSATACGHVPVNSPAATASNLSAVPLVPATHSERVVGEYLVTLDDGVDAKVISDVYGRFGIKSVRAMGQGVFHLILSEDPGPTKMEDVRKVDARIKAVQPNYKYRAN